MLLALEALILCLLFWLICCLGTGTEEKNVRSFRSNPDAVQSMLKAENRLKGKIPGTGPWAVFFSNVLIFSVIFLIFGLPLKSESLFGNFLNILILGGILNAFDSFVMDLLWFRNSRRTRFRGIEDNDEFYRDPRNHRAAFLKGTGAFFAAAVIDGLILSVF